jgi:hypothetical protein
MAGGGRQRPDAAFFGIGARLSDLDKLLGRLIICAQTNWRAISYDADRMADGLFATSARPQRRAAATREPCSVRPMISPSL